MTLKREVKRVWRTLALPLISPVRYADAVAEARLEQSLTCEDCGHNLALTDEERKRVAPDCCCDHPACGCAYLEAE